MLLRLIMKKSNELLLISVFVIANTLAHADSKGATINNRATPDCDTILSSVNQAIIFLASKQTANGAICEPSFAIFDVWETINATMAISLWADYINYDKEEIVKKALDFLKSSENSNGVVLHNSHHQNTLCLETTAEYIRLLVGINRKLTPDINAKIAFVKKLELPSGQWKIFSPIIPEDLQEFPSVTAFAIRALLSANQEPAFKDSALQFLVNAQNSEGHWGAAWQYYGTPFYAMVPILQVLATENSRHKYNKTISKARKYLTSSQKNDGSWFFKSPNLDLAPSPELQTALAIQCCFFCGLKPKDKIVTRGVKWLLSRQTPLGSWSGGYFPYPDRRYRKIENLYATAQGLTAFYEYYIRSIEIDKN